MSNNHLLAYLDQLDEGIASRGKSVECRDNSITSSVPVFTFGEYFTSQICTSLGFISVVYSVRESFIAPYIRGTVLDVYRLTLFFCPSFLNLIVRKHSSHHESKSSSTYRIAEELITRLFNISLIDCCRWMLNVTILSIYCHCILHQLKAVTKDFIGSVTIHLYQSQSISLGHHDTIYYRLSLTFVRLTFPWILLVCLYQLLVLVLFHACIDHIDKTARHYALLIQITKKVQLTALGMKLTHPLPSSSFYEKMEQKCGNSVLRPCKQIKTDIQSSLQLLAISSRKLSTCHDWAGEASNALMSWKEIEAKVHAVLKEEIPSLLIHVLSRHVNPYLMGQEVYCNDRVELCTLSNSPAISSDATLIGFFKYTLLEVFNAWEGIVQLLQMPLAITRLIVALQLAQKQLDPHLKLYSNVTYSNYYNKKSFIHKEGAEHLFMSHQHHKPLVEELRRWRLQFEDIVQRLWLCELHLLDVRLIINKEHLSMGDTSTAHNLCCDALRMLAGRRGSCNSSGHEDAYAATIVDVQEQIDILLAQLPSREVDLKNLISLFTALCDNYSNVVDNNKSNNDVNRDPSNIENRNNDLSESEIAARTLTIGRNKYKLGEWSEGDTQYLCEDDNRDRHRSAPVPSLLSVLSSSALMAVDGRGRHVIVDVYEAMVPHTSEEEEQRERLRRCRSQGNAILTPEQLVAKRHLEAAQQLMSELQSHMEVIQTEKIERIKTLPGEESIQTTGTQFADLHEQGRSGSQEDLLAPQAAVSTVTCIPEQISSIISPDHRQVMNASMSLALELKLTLLNIQTSMNSCILCDDDDDE